MENTEDQLFTIANSDYVSEFTYQVIWPLNLLIIEMVDIVKDKRGKGYGTMLMREVICIADCKGLSIRLKPDDSYGTPMRVLSHFYEKLGFKWDANTAEYVYL